MTRALPLYPLLLHLGGRLCVVVGGGSVAERKVQGLLSSGARVRVVTLSATADLSELSESRAIELMFQSYDKVHLEGAALVFAATNSREVNAQVAHDAAALGAWINVADAPDEGDFVTPATLRRGELVLSVATGGNQPLLAARIASELAVRFGPEYADFVALLGRMRAGIRETEPRAEARRAAYAALLTHEAELLARLTAGDLAGAEAQARAVVEEALEG